MKKRSSVLFLLAAVLLIAGAVLVWIFRDTLLLFLAPKAVLTSAAGRLYGQLEDRFSDGPLALLLENYDPEGRYSAQLQAETENPVLGTIGYDMSVQTDGTSHSLLAQGTASTAGRELEVSLYLDDRFLAVSSKELVQGAWYGITYDSFREDIRNIPLLQYVISDSVVSDWDSSLQQLQAKMETTWAGPDTSAVFQEDVLTALLLLPGRVTETQVKLDGVWTDCFRIDYTPESGQLEPLLPEDTTAAVSFYLCKKALVQVDFYWAAGSDRTNGVVCFGISPGTDPITMTLQQMKSGTYSELSVSVWTGPREEEYTETWLVERDGVSARISYAWDAGDMVLSVNDGPDAVLNLTKIDEGLRIQTADLGMLMEDMASVKQCTMTLQKGTFLTAPEYKNLDQWSPEDFWTLLGGIGSLFGLHTE